MKTSTQEKGHLNWASLAGQWLLYAICVGSVFTAAGIFSEYGYYDDFWQLYFYQHGKFEAPTSLFYQCGRPLQDLVSRPLFTGIDSIAGLAWIRGFNLGVFLLFGGLLLFTFHYVGNFRKSALLLALISTLTPATSIILGWATMIHAPVALVLSLLAGIGAFITWSKAHLSPQCRIGFTLLWFMLTLLAELSYQPCAGAFLLPFILNLARSENGRKSALLALKSILFFSTVLVTYFLVYKISIALWVGEGWFTARANPASNLIEQTLFYLTHILTLIASFWEIFRATRPLSELGIFLDILLNPAVSVSILGLTVYGWIQPLMGHWKSPLHWLRTMAGPCFLGLILAPPIVSSEQYFNFRLFPVVYIALMIWAVQGGNRICERFTAKGRLVRPALIAGGLVIVYFGFQSWYHLKFDLIQPVRLEYKVLTSSVENHFEEYPKALVYAAPAEEYATLHLKRSRIGDFGIPLATLPYGPQNLIKLLLNKQFTGKLAYPPSDSVEVLFLEPAEFVSSPWVSEIQATHLFPVAIQPPTEESVTWTRHSVFGDVLDLGEKWVFSRKFGYLNLSRYPHIRHIQLGWMYYYPEFGYIEFEHPHLGKLNSMVRDFHYWADTQGNYHIMVVENGSVRFERYVQQEDL